MSIQEPTPEFWRAILRIHRCLFGCVMWDFHERGRPDDHVFRSFQTVDVWLDRAIERGWMRDQIVVTEK